MNVHMFATFYDYAVMVEDPSAKRVEETAEGSIWAR